MFRFTSRRWVARSVARLSVVHGVPEGFDFFEHKAHDRDVSAPYEHVETLRLTLTRQDEYLLNERPVRCVTVMSTNGELGIFPSHAYDIVKLVPSPITVELADGAVRRYFASGGFVHINSDASCDINCAECIPLSDLDLDAAEKALAEQQQALAACKDDKARAVVEIRIGVLEAVVQTMKQHP